MPLNKYHGQATPLYQSLLDSSYRYSPFNSTRKFPSHGPVDFTKLVFNRSDSYNATDFKKTLNSFAVFGQKDKSSSFYKNVYYLSKNDLLFDKYRDESLNHKLFFVALEEAFKSFLNLSETERLNDPFFKLIQKKTEKGDSLVAVLVKSLPPQELKTNKKRVEAHVKLLTDVFRHQNKYYRDNNQPIPSISDVKKEKMLHIQAGFPLTLTLSLDFLDGVNLTKFLKRVKKISLLR